MQTFKIGDKVTRMLAGVIPSELTVIKVTNTTLEATINELQGIDFWTFDLKTGAEIDDYLDWGPPPKMTGSYIILDK
jgi:hypothetical protein